MFSPRQESNMGFKIFQPDIPCPGDLVFIDYVFVNNTLLETQMKTKIINFEPKSIKDVPTWDASLPDSFKNIESMPEQVLRPVRMYRCPFREGKHKIVLCDYVLNGKPQVVNTRVPCAEALDKVQQFDCWFGFEQEYFICNHNGEPLGWHSAVKESETRRRWGTVNFGESSGFERQLCETHAFACAYAGVMLYGINREEGSGQWEYQTGPCDGLRAADDLVMSRHLLERVAEMFGVQVSFSPKPVGSSKFVAGLHLNFSTKQMREDGGIRYIEKAISKLSTVPQSQLLKHFDLNNGEDNAKRLMCNGCTPGLDAFTSGVANKRASVRIPPKVAIDEKGYFEERRPSADANPYMVIKAFVRALLLNEEV